MTAIKLGELFRRHRLAANLSQKDVANAVHYHHGTISRIEAGKLFPAKEIIRSFISFLSLPEAETAELWHAYEQGEHMVERLAGQLNLTHQKPVPFVGEAQVTSSDQQPAPVNHSVVPPPTGTVIFLFTDIEGSTRLWELHPQSMPLALERHNVLLHHACEAYSGLIFKTVGDAVCAAFASARDALAAVLAAQRALNMEPWQQIEPLRARMALHAGSAEARAGDYFGPALNRIARILATGHGGQILLSRAAQELVCDDLPANVELRDLGIHRLKDLIRPEHIFQVVTPDLPADFPPLRTLDAHRHNLPAQPNALIGREQELAHVGALLLRTNVRLVTLTGPGGTGKTRLALQVAAELLDRFADGVWFVPLAAISDPGLVVSAIAQMVGIKEVSSQPLNAQLKRYLGPKQLLLVLDNFEQVGVAAPLVAELLASAPQLTVLITSRAVLHLSGEYEFAVLPLALPDRRHLPALEQLTQYEAVRLFIERAQAIKPEFVVTNQSAPAVAEICYRLDGLPLAIELAAARIKLYQPNALLKRLERRLPLLTGGARDLPVRQQTLLNTIAWSYNLLDAVEQRLFRQLAVFVGGWTLEAAEAVASELRIENEKLKKDRDTFSILNPQFSILDGMTSLVNQSLVRPIQGIGGEPRFTMLETIHEFALEQLERNGEADMLRQRHTTYFLALAEAAAPELTGPHQRLWLSQLEQEHDNLRAALQWSCDQQLLETALQFCEALWRFWQFHSHLSAGRGWMEQVLAQSRSLELPVRAQVLCGAGWLAHNQGDHVQAQVLFEESLALARQLRDLASIGMALHGVGQIAADQGDYKQAYVLGDESLRVFRELGDIEEIAWSFTHLSAFARAQGDYDQAKVFGEAGLTHFQKVGHSWGIAIALLNLGYTAQAQGDTAEAATRLREGLVLLQELGDTASSAVALADLADIAVVQGDYAQAADLLRASLTLERDVGNSLTIAWCLTDLASVATAQGHMEQAARLFAAVATLRDTGDMQMDLPQQAEWDRNVATMRAQLGEAAFAAAWAAGRALSLNQAIVEALGAGIEPG
jgi:predicted ATPase/class 3 adenylate cyclase